MIGKIVNRTLILLFVLFFSIFPLYSDNRTTPLDIFFVLDKSLSMENNIAPVKEYVQDFIKDTNTVIPGDNITILGFFGKTEVLVDKTVISDTASRQAVVDKLQNLIGNGQFTDIGLALDTLWKIVSAESDGKRKHMLLLTDGKQEAPPGSKYPSTNFTIEHDLLTDAAIKEMGTWKILVLGIGKENVAKDIAEQIADDYAELSDNPTAAEIEAKSKGFLGAIKVTIPSPFSPIKLKNQYYIEADFTSEGYNEEKPLGIKDILFSFGSIKNASMLNEPFLFTLKPNETKTIRIPIILPKDVPAGDVSATLTWEPLDKTYFTPESVTLTYHIAGLVEKYWWALVILAALILAGLVLLFIYLKENVWVAPVVFKVLIDVRPLVPSTFSLKKDHMMFLNMVNGNFKMGSQKDENSLMAFTARKKRLSAKILNDKIVLANRPPMNLNGWKAKLRPETGVTLDFTVEVL